MTVVLARVVQQPCRWPSQLPPMEGLEMPYLKKQLEARSILGESGMVCQHVVSRKW